ncbi:restriction endonuclease subunit S [Helicobacter pametensis]|uniref:restriction endonuclease subunit S n=1 Tax=Helicobacter pametensis TaxID=95149 RepID=UPI0004AE8D34|nr:restriction endonuclease subunit S [Helicobacter pametensis]
MSAISNPIAYKESGIPWVGKIPEHWSVVRGAFLFANKKVLNSELQCQERLALTMGGVVERDIEKNDGLNPADFRAYQIFEKDDLVFKLIDLDNFKTSRVGYVYKKGIMSSAYIRLIPKQGVFSKYFYYQYFDLYLKHIFNFLGTGVRSTLNSDELLNIEIVFPTLEEQKKIADFLDKKTRQIEEFIDKKQKLIALLEEKKQTLINQCVTQGLDSSTLLKDSGVEWLGQIPTHWETIRVCRIATITNGYAFDSTDLDFLSSVPVVRIGDIQNNSIYLDTCLRTKEQTALKHFLVKNGDILIALSGATVGKIGFYHNECIAYINQRVAIIRGKTNNFLKFCLLTQDFMNFVTLLCNGSAQPNISTRDVGEFKIPFPPLEEQKAIAEYLDTQIEKIDLAISKIKSQINLIKEYKTTLISEAVCGRIGVD